MPRTARASVGGICYHVINRGNNRRDVFRKDGDFQAFLKAMGHACIEIPMPVLGFCLMSNHFHLVVMPKEDGDLSKWMHWVLNTHVRRYHKHYHSSGHIWQGRYQNAELPWLRWWDLQGNLLPTGEERAERLAAQLRALGVEPEV